MAKGTGDILKVPTSSSCYLSVSQRIDFQWPFGTKTIALSQEGAMKRTFPCRTGSHLLVGAIDHFQSDAIFKHFRFLRQSLRLIISFAMWLICSREAVVPWFLFGSDTKAYSFRA